MPTHSVTIVSQECYKSVEGVLLHENMCVCVCVCVFVVSCTKVCCVEQSDRNESNSIRGDWSSRLHSITLHKRRRPLLRQEVPHSIQVRVLQGLCVHDGECV
jgi:hypothetical protein